MARLLETIKRIVVDESATWMREGVGDAVLEGLARIFQRGEEAWDSIKLQLYRQTATGSWLDKHLEQAGAEPRHPGEGDDTARERAILTPKGTVKWVQDQIALAYRRAGYGDFYRVRFFEPHATVTDDGFFTDDWESITVGEHAPKHLFWVHVPRPEVVQLPDGGMFTDYLDANSCTDADESFTGEALLGDRRLIYEEVQRICEQARAAGAAFGLTCEPTVEAGHLAVMFFDLEAEL